jgi:hypothetical protein
MRFLREKFIEFCVTFAVVRQRPSEDNGAVGRSKKRRAVGHCSAGGFDLRLPPTGTSPCQALPRKHGENLPSLSQDEDRRCPILRAILPGRFLSKGQSGSGPASTQAQDKHDHQKGRQELHQALGRPLESRLGPRGS